MEKTGGEVTVIIPVYNTEKYLEKCIESVINQTFKDLEIILINDCSTDGSLKIIRKYEKIDKRIKVIDLLENLGHKKARNLGINIASGDYITNIDSDDFLSLDCFDKQIELMEEKKLDICIYNMYFYYDEYKRIRANKEKVNKIFSGREAFIKSLDWRITSQGIFKKEIFKQIKEDEEFFNEDEFTTRKRFFFSNKVGIGEGKYFYRQHNDSYVHKINFKFYEYFLVNDKLREFIKSNCQENYVKEKFERISHSKLINVLRRYLEEKRYFSKKEKEYIEIILENELKKINRKEVFMFYLKRMNLFKFFSKEVKLYNLVKKIGIKR